MSSEGDDSEFDMNDYFDDILRSLDISQLAELAIMTKKDVEDFLGARVLLPDTYLGEPERFGSQSFDEDLLERVTGGAETSTPIKNHFPIYSKRKSSMFGESS